MIDKKYGVTITTTDGTSQYVRCEDIELDEVEGVLTLYKPILAGLMSKPITHRVYMLRHILYYDVSELSE